MEFFINDLTFGYHFKIWDISSKGISLLVNEDCDLVNYLKLGDVLNLKYHTSDSSRPIRYLKTAIRHISKGDTRRFKGSYVFGLSILKDHGSEKEEKIRVVCPTCNTSYNIPSNKIPVETRLVATCRKCGGKIMIKPRAAKRAHYS